MNTAYLKNIIDLLEKLESTQEEVIEQVSAVCADCIYNGGLLYFFGTGHSHMVCEEPFYRAGGLACVYPILETDLMLHEGASKSSGYERLEGLGNVVIANTSIGKGDVLFIASNSGRNCAVIDAAMEAKKRGAITVAITSMNHTTQVASRHSSGLNLFQVCDYVLDNGGELGDASVELAGLGQKIAPTSSVIDITLVNLIVVNTVELLLQKGMMPPVFMSANTDAGDEALYPHIRQFAEDLVTFMYDNEYECTDEEIQAFFKEKYEMADDETVTLLALFMCNKLYHFGWDAPKIFSSEKGWFRRLEQLEGDDEE